MPSFSLLHSIGLRFLTFTKFGCWAVRFQGPIYIGEDTKPTRAPICVNVSHLEDIASASLSKSST